MADREERAYKITWLMPLGMGGSYGVLQQDMPRRMEHAGNHQLWRNQSDCGMAVCQALEGAGFNLEEVGERPVYMQRRQGRAVYWVPYARFYRHGKPAGYQTHYIPVRVEEVPLAASELPSRSYASREGSDRAERREHAEFLRRRRADSRTQAERETEKEAEANEARGNYDRLVHGVLHEAGWHSEARQAILRGPYAFADYLKPAQHVPTEEEIARFKQHDIDEIMQANLHHSTERGGHWPQLYHGTDDAQWESIGETTEHPRTKE